MKKFLAGLGVLLLAAAIFVGASLGGRGAREAIGERRSATSGELEIAYYDGGAGEAVVLLASWARPVSDFNELALALHAAGYRTLAVESRGIGGSEGGGPFVEVGRGDLAADVAAVLDASALEEDTRVTVVGHAFGNQIARTFASRYPSRTAGVVLIAAGGRVKVPAELTEALFVSSLGFLPESWREPALRRAFFAEGSEVPDHWKSGWSLWGGLAQDGAVRADDAADFWGAGGVPMLVFQAEQDAIAPPDQAGLALRSEFPDRVTLVQVPDAGHALLPEQPTRIAQTLVAYLRANASTALERVHRFTLAGAEGAHASIGHERRAVVAGYAAESHRAPLKLRRTGVARQTLSDRFADVARVVVQPTYADRERSFTLAPRVQPVVPSPRNGKPQIALDLPTRLENGLPIEGIDVTALPETVEVELATTEALVGEGARLEFGFGVLETAQAEGDVAFELEICGGGTCRVAFEEVLAAADATRWHDRSLPLIESVGQRVALRLRARLHDETSGRFTQPVWSVPSLYAPAPRSADRRSVILISFDTLRADHLNAYGYPRATSPFMARKFGDEGVIFDHLVAAATLTGPSHMTIFTSLPPSVHGDGLGPAFPRADVVTLAEQLRDHGFETAAFTENAAIDSRHGHARGFDEFTEDKGGETGLPKGQIERTFASGLEWWRRHRDKPFFLFLHTYQTHAPYLPAEGYRELVAEESGDEAVLPEVELYDAEIRHVDDQLRELLATLEREGWRDTVLIVTSDHGEEFGEHGFRGHGVTLHAELTGVPLMLLGAGIPAGRRVTDPAAHVDLMPTILELAGVPAPVPLMGRSLVASWASGEAAQNASATPAFSETWLGFAQTWEGERVKVGAPGYAVRLGDRKLVRYRERESGELRHEYFDLAEDPGEQRNRYDASRPEVAELQRLLDEFPSRAAAVRTALGRGQQPAGDLDPERERKLRALGYIVD